MSLRVKRKVNNQIMLVWWAFNYVNSYMGGRKENLFRIDIIFKRTVMKRIGITETDLTLALIRREEPAESILSQASVFLPASTSP